ncbi:hypothetical protein Dxin01_00863 [Deinococcus xinjiangensis]|uniref:DUF2325 domain-containing protein n=1 Tax=Deinococcus xinjiangensis TaxID=457454 RepID=A0ABP9V793_9DEIO
MPQLHPDFSEIAAQLRPIEQKLTTGHVEDRLKDRTALADAQRIEDTFLSGQLFLLAWQLEQNQPSEAHFQLARDLLTTYAAHHPGCELFLARLRHYGQALGYVGTSGAPFLTVELPHAAAILRAWVNEAGLTLPPALQLGATADLLYQCPATPQNPREVPLTALEPPAPRSTSRLALYGLLSALQGQADPDQQLLILLLLHLHVRERLENLPVLPMLQLAAQLLLILADEARERHAPCPLTGQLRRAFQTLHAELEGVQVAALKAGAVVRKAERPHVRHEALTLLRQQRAARAGLIDMALYSSELMLWSYYERLDEELARGAAPENHPALRAELILSTLHALSSSHRSPGGDLSAVATLAAEQSGIDPLWAWVKVAPVGERSFYLQDSLHRLFAGLELLRQQDLPFWPTYERRVWRLLARLAAQVFATARQLGTPLPEEAFLKAYFAQFGPALSRTLTMKEFALLHSELAELLLAFSREKAAFLATQVPQQEPEAAVIAGHEAVKNVDERSALPPLVAQARTLLAGKRVVLIGGRPSANHHAAIVEGFQLAELDWIDPDEYAHGSHAASRLTPQTSLLIIALRWMGHAHSTLKDVARERGVPAVLHPSGLNPVSLAYQVLGQASRQLQSAAVKT